VRTLQKQDINKAHSVLNRYGASPFDFFLIQFDQTYYNTMLDELTKEVVEKLFTDTLLFIKVILGDKLKNVDTVVLMVELEHILNDLKHDMVSFRIMFVGKNLKEFRNTLKKPLDYYITEKIGGTMSMTYLNKQTYSDVLTELLPIFDQTIQNPKKRPTEERKYYSDDLYQMTLDPVRLINPADLLDGKLNIKW